MARCRDQSTQISSLVLLYFSWTTFLHFYPCFLLFLFLFLFLFLSYFLSFLSSFLLSFSFWLFRAMLHLQHMEVPRPGVELELQLPAYAIAIATWDLSWICYLHHSSQQHWILNPLRKARDQTHILMDTNRVHNLPSHNRRSPSFFLHMHPL